MTTLVMVAILLVGLVGFYQLPINNLPAIDFPTISVQAQLPGASPETMATTVATVLERQCSTISGIDSMNSTSSLGSTSVTLQFNLDRNIDSAAQDVQTAIAASIPLLPPMPTRPFYRKVNPADQSVLLLQLSSDTLPMNQVDEYAETLVAQNVSMVDGVAQVNVFGAQKFAVRARVDPRKLNSSGIGIDQVAAAISSGTVKLPTGALFGKDMFYNIQSNDQLTNAAGFRSLIVAVRNGVPVRLQDLGEVSDSVENTLVSNWTRGGRAIVLGVQRQPGTNVVAVIDEIKRRLPALQAQLPNSVAMSILFDRTINIRESVNDVEMTLLITVLLVVAVIFMFLRNSTATVISSLSLPASLIGTFAVMAMLDYSLDDLSLMALTLCVGFVVDDAIVVLESIVRHLEMGKDQLSAALEGTREVSFTIISMTISLVAVFIPLLFLGGLIGRIFREFAVTITASILISGFVSLSLIPMLCRQFLRPTPHSDIQAKNSRLERLFDFALGFYGDCLRLVLRYPKLTMFFNLGVVALTVYLATICPKGFIPTADTGQIFGNTEAAQNISFADMKRHQAKFSAILNSDPNIENYMSAIGSSNQGGSINTGRALISLKPRHQRKLSADQVIQNLRKQTSGIPGIRLFMQNPPAIRLGGQSTKGLYQITLQGNDLKNLYTSVSKMVELMKSVPGVQDPTADVQASSLQVRIEVDRNKAAALGLSARQIDNALGSAYGTSQVATILSTTNQYKVILEVLPEFLAGPEQLGLLNVRSSSGKLVPLKAFATIEQSVSPLTITHLGQLPSATISFNLLPTASLGDVVKAVKETAAAKLPAGVTASLQGNARAFQKALAEMLALLVVAVLIIYIVLGILYESFVHPITILAGLPSAGLGAILTLMLFGRDLDVYGFLGLILLIGIVKKNAIMMIDYALAVERRDGRDAASAIYEACLVRFRPIMMTTVAAIMGSLPLAVGWGAGGEARQPLGLAVVGGLLVSQLLTLFITPVIYIYIDSWSGGFRKLPRLMQLTSGPLESRAGSQAHE
jgi:hydrophobic/amphiphilic exporter-1 (mainly G- bacteria), HAE1 family